MKRIKETKPLRSSRKKLTKTLANEVEGVLPNSIQKLEFQLDDDNEGLEEEENIFFDNISHSDSTTQNISRMDAKLSRNDLALIYLKEL
ncbi:hypothetical protein GcM3_012042 [Golovinomyces cichoracearum]|uniref:Uncharacterized protein n=1 Tax=Golovinomyces cichoracearum TaxID=62708 RepID=A0A420J9P4_9PEZI|nr:hypothetical protein GcM3_012042 [Golovinomyces cichoracearum]